MAARDTFPSQPHLILYSLFYFIFHVFSEKAFWNENKVCMCVCKLCARNRWTSPQVLAKILSLYLI